MSKKTPSCGLVSGQDWLHYCVHREDRPRVADWSQAKIGYTESLEAIANDDVADWSQAKIGYTRSVAPVAYGLVADWSQAKIGYTPVDR